MSLFSWKLLNGPSPSATVAHFWIEIPLFDSSPSSKLSEKVVSICSLSNYQLWGAERTRSRNLPKLVSSWWGTMRKLRPPAHRAERRRDDTKMDDKEPAWSSRPLPGAFMLLPRLTSPTLDTRSALSSGSGNRQQSASLLWRVPASPACRSSRLSSRRLKSSISEARGKSASMRPPKMGIKHTE